MLLEYLSKCKASDLMQRQSYLVKTVLEQYDARKETFLLSWKSIRSLAYSGGISVSQFSPSLWQTSN